MSSPLESLVATGTKLWLDSIDPELVQKNFEMGATGATSNPIIIADLIKTGRFDQLIEDYLNKGYSDEEIAWATTDQMVKDAQTVFKNVWTKTEGNDGYVSFELDPLIEDTAANMPHKARVSKYIDLAQKWSQGHHNRMIKIPATPAGLDSLEEIAAMGLTINVTLIFSQRQYDIARDAIWQGRQRYGNLDNFKSVYSIFISRIDVYTQKHVTDLSDDAQGQVGIYNAKKIARANKSFWADKNLKLEQELIFASTGTKNPDDPKDKYVKAFAGRYIQTNPPATNDAVQELGTKFTHLIDIMPSDEVIAEIEKKVNIQHLEDTLMSEGLEKFADPQKALIQLICDKRKSIGKVA